MQEDLERSLASHVTEQCGRAARYHNCAEIHVLHKF